MRLSIHKAHGVDNTPWLARCFREYFAPGQFVFDRSHLVDVKWRRDGFYCVLLFKVGDKYHVADVAGTKYGGDRYEVLNDAGDTDLETWRGLRVDPYCDGYTLASERSDA